MQRTLRKVPVFPLNIVGSPGASRQLRIFEPRYRQMFQDLMSEVRAPTPAANDNRLTYLCQGG